MVKVSVVIPVYGVERYIERCARSLFEQTLDELEYIFVNDCTKDRSMDVLRGVLDDYPCRKSQVVIVDCATNGGQAAARSIGMKRASGEYVIQCDSDDWVDKKMYELLYGKAMETGADVVSCNQYNIYRGYTEIQENSFTGTPHRWLREYRGSWGACTKLVRSRLIKANGIYPFEGLNFSEDRCVMMRAFYYANKVELVEEPLYYYDRTREDAITNRYKTNVGILHQRELVMRKMEEWFSGVGFDMGDNMLHWKWQMSVMYLFMRPREWNEWRRFLPETLDFVLRGGEKCFTKFCYRAASKGWLLPIKSMYAYKDVKAHIKNRLKSLTRQ